MIAGPVYCSTVAVVALEYWIAAKISQTIIQTYLLLPFNLLQREINSDYYQRFSQTLTEFFALLDEHCMNTHEEAGMQKPYALS